MIEETEEHFTILLRMAVKITAATMRTVWPISSIPNETESICGWNKMTGRNEQISPLELSATRQPVKLKQSCQWEFSQNDFIHRHIELYTRHTIKKTPNILYFWCLIYIWKIRAKEIWKRYSFAAKYIFCSQVIEQKSKFSALDRN